mmetsp:Transcript_59688/g.82872  ORF Transcript_59688/g.82872 Transcript_59688/m.82872 type:complete len:266 (-) Transcript_59688:242-1039(-)
MTGTNLLSHLATHGLGNLGHQLFVAPILLQGGHAVLLDVLEDRLELRIVLEIVELSGLSELLRLGLESRVVDGHILEVALHQLLGLFLGCPEVVRLHCILITTVDQSHNKPIGALQGLLLLCGRWHNHGLLAVQLGGFGQSKDDDLIAGLVAGAGRSPHASHASHPRRHSTRRHSTHCLHPGLWSSRRLGELGKDPLVLLVLLHGFHAVLLDVLKEILELWIILQLRDSLLGHLGILLQSSLLLRVLHHGVDFILELLHLLRILC